MNCPNCGYIKQKVIKMDLDEEPKKKICRICKEEFNNKKEHNKTDRHMKIKQLIKNLSLIKDDHLDNFEGLVNNYIINN